MSVQEAIDAVPDFRKIETKIFIKSGVYWQKLVLPTSKINVTFIGEDKENTILTYDDFATKHNKFGEVMGTTGSSSFFVFADNFTAKNLTFENGAGPVGQAVAVRMDGDRAIFENCKIYGKNKGYITAASTEKDSEYGFVFINCKILGDGGEDTFYLGRPWRDYAQ